MQHPYSAFLKKVDKPSRYTGAEHGTRRKDWGSVQARVCLAFPDIYDIGMSHLGFRILYKILNDHPETLAERCYAPWVDMQRELIAHGEFLRSLENHRPLADFDVVGFSLQYELTYTNILAMLDLGGIPLRAASRGEGDPLVIAGGPVATHAEPMAPFFDAILIGDGEEAAREIALLWTSDRKAGVPRAQRLKHLAKLPGVYVPSLYDTAIDENSGLEVVTGSSCAEAPFPVERRLITDLSKFPFPDDGPVGGPEAIFDRMSIEVARGCTEGCRFCQAGMIYRPVRERDPEEVIRTVESALKKSGQDEVALTALSTADVSCISPLIKRLVEKTAPERVSLSVASLRAYGLAEDLLDDIRKVRAAGLTFAPEAGTQRMRDVVNKNVTEEQLLETAERVFSRGFDRMKLYFMIGLPTEEDEDVLGIIEVGKNAFNVAKRVKNYRAKVTVSVSTHVPKPHTPFQWCAMNTLPEVRRKQALLKAAARPHRGLTLRVHDSVTSELEGVLARGDRRLADAIEHAYLHGAKFDSWEEHLKLDVWEAAFARFGVDKTAYLGTFPIHARLPWDHFDMGLEEGFLAREYRKALANRLSPPCGKVAGSFIHHTNLAEASKEQKRLVCYDCGVACDLTKMKEDRLQFLRTMGALEPGQRARLPVIHEGQAQKIGPERYRPPQLGGTGERWRLRFTKTGAAALLGHLDLLRELPRVIRRAGARTAYTEGFHPKPDLSMGPALALGTETLEEYVDIRLITDLGEAALLERLRAASSNGLEFTGARRLGANDPAIGKVIHEAHYLIVFAESALRELCDVVELERRIQEFNQASLVEVRRNIKGLGRMVNVRRFISELRLAEDAEKARLSELGIEGRLVTLFATATLGPDGSARPSEIVSALFAGAPIAHKVVRIALTSENASPMDLEQHRRAPKQESPSFVAVPFADDMPFAEEAVVLQAGIPQAGNQTGNAEA